MGEVSENDVTDAIAVIVDALTDAGFIPDVSGVGSVLTVRLARQAVTAIGSADRRRAVSSSEENT